MHYLDIVAENDVPFRVVLLGPGEENAVYPAATDEHAIVEFYDRRYPHTEHGQFTGARYFLSTLLEEVPWYYPLALDGGVREWRLDHLTRRVVTAWARILGAPETAREGDRFAFDSGYEWGRKDKAAAEPYDRGEVWSFPYDCAGYTWAYGGEPSALAKIGAK